MVIYWIASDQLIVECNEMNNRYMIWWQICHKYDHECQWYEYVVDSILYLKARVEFSDK